METVCPLNGAAIQACRLQRADGTEDVLRNGLAGIDEAGGEVGLQARWDRMRSARMSPARYSSNVTGWEVTTIALRG